MQAARYIFIYKTRVATEWNDRSFPRSAFDAVTVALNAL